MTIRVSYDVFKRKIVFKKLNADYNAVLITAGDKILSDFTGCKRLVSSFFITCEVSGETMDVDIEEEVRIEGEHVEEVVEDGAEDRHPRVHHQEEGQHLKRAPQRL